ncbi:hypothetical protein Adt_25226 [Abeliophyllum distichum]|uniref:Late embryogenesis abundant protein LEA-2 subgroup domain-containing protein n=1 Tax=Abeliophyllum distichum TaxID=126358 RepID=A0ABD1SG87_9LAMI
MSMHAKTDSEVTSLAPSSPNRPVYYVQSPSRDSHDGEKTTNSFHSTPILSPVGSPGRHSRDSSSTRYSGSLKPGSQKSSNGSRRHQHHRKGEKGWKEFDAIEEEGLLDEEGGYKGIPRRCYLLAFIVGFFVLFTFFALILWGASRNQKPIVTVKSVTFDKFMIQAGSDNSGVGTEMINKFYQSRKGQRQLTVMLRGSNIPLYGGGANLSSKDGKPVVPVPLTLNFVIRARAYVLGRLVKPKFLRRVQCSVVMDPKKMNVAVSLKNNLHLQLNYGPEEEQWVRRKPCS